jgi:hypothetical protein
MKLNLFLLSAAAMVNAAIADSTPSVDLRSAESYVILAKTGISTVPQSSITGDIAVSPIAAAAITGFSSTMDSGEQFSTSSQVTGRMYAANYHTPIPSLLTTAVSDMETAYTDAAGRSNPATTNLGSGSIGGLTLGSGVHNFGSDVNIATSTQVVFSGNDTEVFIIQISGDLVQAANTQVILEGGAKAENIFWQVAGTVEVGAGAHLEGVLLVKTCVTFITGSSLNGRIMSQTHVALQQATIN